MFSIFKFNKIHDALKKTRAFLGDKIQKCLRRGLTSEAIEELEKIFFEADLGTELTEKLLEKVKLLSRKISSPEEILIEIQKELVEEIKGSFNTNLQIAPTPPTVILIVGVNGSGKTSVTAKLAQKFQKENKKVLIGAGDTFRAAAIEQLSLWADKLGIDIVKGPPHSDAASIAYDTISAAKARKTDIVLLDTAGRLHTKTNLMQELEKMRRVCQKALPDSPHETLFILDATLGQNALNQAQTFHQFLPLTGLIVTKLDGTAKGGIIIPLQEKLKVPVKFISYGETADDFAPFESETFVKALFE